MRGWAVAVKVRVCARVGVMGKEGKRREEEGRRRRKGKGKGAGEMVLQEEEEDAAPAMGCWIRIPRRLGGGCMSSRSKVDSSTTTSGGGGGGSARVGGGNLSHPLPHSLVLLACFPRVPLFVFGACFCVGRSGWRRHACTGARELYASAA